jgi:23S rRNA pseudouridine1911/1915/1917 synthase
MTRIRQQLDIGVGEHGLRLDQALHRLLPEYSRSRQQAWIREGQVLLNGAVARPKDKVSVGDRLDLDIPETTQVFDRPEAVEFGLLHEDDQFFVVDKPAGLVVHPAAGHASGTLLNGLLHRDPRLEQLPRAGIVHRLDKDTSGVMVVARTLKAHAALVGALQARDIKREYVAIAQGRLTAGQTIDAPIARHPVDRKRMAVREDGKEAVTHYSVRERYPAHTRIDVRLETGRTHQIRVHLAWLKHPLLGDPVYGGRFQLPKQASASLREALAGFRRQALHARRLSFEHPLTGEPLSFEAPLPPDLRHMIEVLREDAARQDGRDG